MSFRAYRLTPVDTWFFRDGRPYNQGESYQNDIKSLFPPFAVTSVGAMRASIARSLGWKGKGDWPSNIKIKVGDGRNLKPLSFMGPYLVKNIDGKPEVLFPAPLHLLGKHAESKDGQWEQLTLLQPGKEIDCDIGDRVRLPASRNAIGLKSLYGSYLTSKDLAIVLNGGDLSNISPLDGKSLWDFDFLVGIERNSETHTTVEGALYSISRVRLNPGVGLVLEVDGLEPEIKPKSLMPFGGEGRLAHVDQIDDPIRIPKPPNLESDSVIRFTVTHLTPAYFKGRLPGPGEELPGIIGSKIISACLERPVRIGGWDTVNGEPLPLEPFLPGGSTWFCETDCDKAKEIMKLSGKFIGNYCEYGFGQIAIGRWN